MYRPYIDRPPKKFSFVKFYETGLSDFHNLALIYDLLQELSCQNVHPGEFENFKYISSKVLNNHASVKENMLDVTNLPS